MKVLLVNTNRMTPPVAPIGLDYLAESLSAAGHEPRLLDLCFSDDIGADIGAAVDAFEPDAIGVSVRNTDDCYFASGAFFLPGIREMIDLLRRVSRAPVVMGGVGFSVMPEAIMEFCGADYGIAGEGEAGLPLLLDALQGRRSLTEVPGLVHRQGDQLLRNPAADATLHLLPPRRRTFVDNPRYFREGGQAGFETRRGCAMSCIYCADPVSKGRRVRLRPAALVVEELAALLSMGIDTFHSCDCEFNLPVEHARDVCQAIITAGLAERIRWYAYCSPTPFDADTAMLFRRAGCAGIDFGADSGSAGMLRCLGRHFGPEDLLATARACRQAGIPFMYDLMIGGPGETRETVRDSFDLVRRADPDCVGVSLGMRIYDGTPIAGMVRGQGDLASNPALRGATGDNARFLLPVFYLSPGLGDGAEAYIRDLVAGDTRFFLPSGPDRRRRRISSRRRRRISYAGQDYNYNDNTLLVEAIRAGARGAYWDILRRGLKAR